MPQEARRHNAKSLLPPIANAVSTDSALVWEAGISRRITKTKGAYNWEQIGSVHFSRGCAPGVFV